MSRLSTSVLIASCRPRAVTRCLESLAVQTTPPDEVIVAWQADDTATRDAASSIARSNPAVRLVHSPEPGVVPAENAALSQASGAIILLIDDDAVAPPDWIARHLSHYGDPRVGAVGGSFDNYNPDGAPFPKRSAEPVGKITWYGKLCGNTYDHDPAWRSRAPIEVHHLAGGNMSLRREAFGRFEFRLRRYWQLFEMDACWQVRNRGYSVLFDFANVIDHYPTSTTFAAGRDGDLTVKIYNSAYNHAFVMSKHLRGWRRAVCWGYLIGVGSVNTPGLAGFFAGVLRHGKPARELTILRQTWQSRFAGWREGASKRREMDSTPAPKLAALTQPRSPGSL